MSIIRLRRGFKRPFMMVADSMNPTWTLLTCAIIPMIILGTVASSKPLLQPPPPPNMMDNAMIGRLLERSLANRKAVYPIIRQEAIEVSPLRSETIKNRYMGLHLREMVDRLEEEHQRVNDQSAFMRHRLY